MPSSGLWLGTPADSSSGPERSSPKSRSRTVGTSLRPALLAMDSEV